MKEVALGIRWDELFGRSKKMLLMPPAGLGGSNGKTYA